MADTDSRHRARHRPPHSAARRAAARHADLAHGRHWRVGILAIIVFTGHPAAGAPRRRRRDASTPLAPNPDRLRDYQDRLRVLDERARQQALSRTPSRDRDAPARRTSEPPAAAGTPIRSRPSARRREYESLFASNVVISRRPDGTAARDGTAAPRHGHRAPIATGDGAAAPPSLDDVADAVVRATSAVRAKPRASTTTAPAAVAPAAPVPRRAPRRAAAPGDARRTRDPSASTGPLHRILEGTVIDTVLTNRLDGSVAAPVNCLVTNAVYSHDGQHVLIPAGSRVLGETKPVQAFGETRLAVAFNRLVLPDGRTYRLDQFMGLNEIGDAGLRDQVNQHYLSTFGASAAVGLITGFAQFLGTAGLQSWRRRPHRRHRRRRRRRHGTGDRAER